VAEQEKQVMSISGPQNINMGNAATVEKLLGSTVNNALAAGPAGIAYTHLSPESLLELIGRQIQKLDGDIFDRMRSLEARREASQKLGEATGALKEANLGLEENAQYFNSAIKVSGIDYKTPNGQGGNNTGVLKQQSFPNTPAGEKAAQEFAASLTNPTTDVPAKPESVTDLQKKLQLAAEKATAAGYGNLGAELQKMADDLAVGKAPSKGTIEKLMSDTENAVNAMSSASEITMIELQDLVQQRSRTIMFASNVLATINDAARKTVDNLR
jgi:hypothetical protein